MDFLCVYNVSYIIHKSLFTTPRKEPYLLADKALSELLLVVEPLRQLVLRTFVVAIA